MAAPNLLPLGTARVSLDVTALAHAAQAIGNLAARASGGLRNGAAKTGDLRLKTDSVDAAPPVNGTFPITAFGAEGIASLDRRMANATLAQQIATALAERALMEHQLRQSQKWIPDPLVVGSH